MEENLKIISNGAEYEVYLYGKRLLGVCSVGFSATTGEIPVVSLNMYIDPNDSIRLKDDDSSITELIYDKLKSLSFPDVVTPDITFVCSMYNGTNATTAHQIYHKLFSLKEQEKVLAIKDRYFTITALGFDVPEHSCKDDYYAVMMTVKLVTEFGT